MGKTVLTIQGEDFFINGKKTYAEIDGSKESSHGLLMNARFIQGIFDEKEDISRFNRFGVDKYDPDKNTDDLIASLDEWYDYGLRAFTVGIQGGGPCFTISNDTINNNPFSDDGLSIDPKYLDRLDRIIRAADEKGMVVIVSYFYHMQISRMKDATTVVNAVKTASKHLKNQKYTNVMIEIGNEHNAFKSHPIALEDEGMAVLINIAKEASGGMPVGSSLVGGYYNEQVTKVSDVILIHGNNCSRQKFYNLIQKVREISPGKPVVCNEDSQSIGNMEVAFNLHASWGYYNNLTKQEPPVKWGVLNGEDKFFAYRMAQGIGIKLKEITKEEQFYFHGFEPEIEYEGKRWLRVASLNPETINYVNFYKGDELIYTCYDEPFSLFWFNNWKQNPLFIEDNKGEWTAEIVLSSGEIITKKNKL